MKLPIVYEPDIISGGDGTTHGKQDVSDGTKAVKPIMLDEYWRFGGPDDDLLRTVDDMIEAADERIRAAGGVVPPGPRYGKSPRKN